MKLKTLLTSSMLVVAIAGSSVFAASYPVQPANNGIAKRVIQWIFTDKWLAQKTTQEARIEAANSANVLSDLIVRSIKEMGIAKDGYISDEDVRKLNQYMYEHYHNQVMKLHGDDEKVVKVINGKRRKVKIETWLHRVINNGATAVWKIPVKRGYKKANRVIDGIFHLWLNKTVNKKRILNEDWNTNVRWRLINKALNYFLKDDLNLHKPVKKHKKHKRK